MTFEQRATASSTHGERHGLNHRQLLTLLTLYYKVVGIAATPKCREDAQ
jgi:hypothetical protein